MLLADCVFAGGSLVWKWSCYGVSWTIGKRKLNMSRDRSKVSATFVYKHESGTYRYWPWISNDDQVWHDTNKRKSSRFLIRWIETHIGNSI